MYDCKCLVCVGKREEVFKKQFVEALRIIRHQTCIEALWIPPDNRLETLDEKMLRGALRHLHAVLEGDPELAEKMKKEYWNVEADL